LEWKKSTESDGGNHFGSPTSTSFKQSTPYAHVTRRGIEIVRLVQIFS